MTYESDTTVSSLAIWTKVIAWLEIIYSVFRLVLTVCLCAGLSFVSGDLNDEGRAGERIVLRALLVVALLISALGLSIGILLLIGNAEERPTYLWVWIVLSGISLVFIIFSDIGSAINGKKGQLCHAACKLIFTGLFIYIVHLRMLEIESGAKQD